MGWPRRYYRYGWGLGALGLGALMAFVPLRLHLARGQAPQPQGILVLGGNPNRIYWGADLAQRQPQLPVWVSDLPAHKAADLEVFQSRGIAPGRITYDTCATDTVTNFTCTLRDISRRGLQHLWLVTSDSHMDRALAIAYWIFGSRGILVSPYPVPCHCSTQESAWHILRDQLRSLVWLFSGHSGAPK
jgi:uncharacterized SAM-binding protein YcdF (DUF218 family)